MNMAEPYLYGSAIILLPDYINPVYLIIPWFFLPMILLAITFIFSCSNPFVILGFNINNLFITFIKNFICVDNMYPKGLLFAKQ